MKKYIDERGWKYQVMGGIGSDRYKARYQRAEQQVDGRLVVKQKEEHE